MGFNVNNRSPGDGAVVSPGSVALVVGYNITGGYYIYQHKFHWRKGGGTWVSGSQSGNWQGVCSFGATTYLGYGDSIEWYSTAYYVDASGGYHVATLGTWNVYSSADTEAPVVDSENAVPQGSVVPTFNGVTFSIQASDNDGLSSLDLFIDGVLVGNVPSGIYTKRLTKGAHTHKWIARDYAGNTAESDVLSFTVENAAPVVPAGAAVNVASEVANLGSVLVTWTPFADPNEEDSLTYTIWAAYNGGGWQQLATGLTSCEYYWTPNDGLGTAQLQVQASDGTATSPTLASAVVSIVSSQSPLPPAVTAPEGAESWREGETHTITWAAGSHPEGVPIYYRIQFSALGDFTDAVTVAVASSLSYAWALPTGLVNADTATCKVRVRAEDFYSKVSDWSTSAAFSVIENACPTVTAVYPADGDIITGNEPMIVVLVDDADGDTLHVEVQASVRSDFVGATTANSAVDQTGWEQAAGPGFSAWGDVPSGGATAGCRVRWQAPPLRYDRYYLRARVSDGLLTSEWSPVSEFIVTPSGVVPLTCTIGETDYSVQGVKVYEKTNGEPSPIEFAIALTDYRAEEVSKGAVVSIGLALGGLIRTWNGTVETVQSKGASVQVYCLQDDAYATRKLVTGDRSSADIGANLAALVATYGAPLDNAGMDTSLGVSAAIVGDYKQLGAHLSEWADVLGYLWWVDSTGTVHLAMPSDLDPPEIVLWEEYDG